MKKILLLIIALLIICFESFVSAEEKNEWALTQYSDDSGSQGMFYSLINRYTNSLILIDGGWEANAGKVRKVIDENGGHVTAWFLTHYHKDHCEAFNVLWNEFKDRIDRVYVTPLGWDEFESVAKSWDNPDTFATFLEQTKGSDIIKALNRGDQFEISGLKVSVFNSCDDIVRKYSDIPNNCSLIFKISSSKQSVLFLGDAHNEDLGREILNMYGAETLHADYVQAAHHGNHAQSNEFFLAINPSVIFLDGPEWLMTSEKHKAKEFLAWCKEQGFKTYDYRQAPTTFILQ